MDIRLWSKELITDFINVYKSYPCLWRVKSEEYKNKNLRDEAYGKMVDFCKIRGFPEANRDFVVKKIQSLRGSFRKEVKKSRELQRNGRNIEDMYTSSLWYYDLLLFTKEQDIASENISNMDDSENHNFEYESKDDEKESVTEEMTTSSYTEELQLNNIGAASELLLKPRKRKLGDSQTEFLEMCTAILRTNCQTMNEFDAVGVNVSKKLARMEPLQAIYAESLINRILRKGLLNELTDETDFYNVSMEMQVNRNNSSIKSNALNGENMFIADKIKKEPIEKEDLHYHIDFEKIRTLK